MSGYQRNHYIQNKLLNNFANKSKNGRFKINIIDLHEKKIFERNTDRAFYINNLYDVKESDIKILEKDLNVKIETPFNKILNRLVNEEYDTFTITREELEVIKKYLLVQQYRNYKNSLGYNENCDKSVVLSRYNILENETQLDFWKRELRTILNNSFDDLISTNKLVGVKQKTMNIYCGFLMFVHTCQEFVINDLGYVTERVLVNLKMAPNEYAKANEELGEKLFGVKGFGDESLKRAENNSEYIDNFMFYPVSSDLAILVVNDFWKKAFLNSIDIYKLGVSPSPLLINHFSLPINKFVNHKLIKSQSDIIKYKSNDDKYIYKIHELSDEETKYINRLLLNEAYRYVGFKTKDLILPSITSYIEMQDLKVKNVKNDFRFVIE